MDLINYGYRIAKGTSEFDETFFSLSAHLGKLVFATRLEKKLTQQELAEQAEVSPKTIHRIEGGAGGVTDNTYDKVFDVLEISGEEIGEYFLQKSH
ncbi:helix-turn-helix transcriptional regulator [Natribacillus halophilus]|uniref:DNA-binding transcriptional regulator, XRE family n=1 Tax=Natribacillus halophilus TaxID=549003 RepID=A0A1G8Q7X2_9BACI|nr:helix-turn-helix transcriptional regulator [Natribacillus halophilus]SDJ00929.1 DNA-binding transcriptional regulator, XRE family [Natribacillus halophilus]